MKCTHAEIGEIGSQCNPGCWRIVRYSPDSGFAPYAAGIDFVCPCGCGDAIWLPLRLTNARANEERPEWQWDGNEAAPTLTPSIRRLERCRWHGYLTNGQWSSCSDGPAVHAEANA